ncbi:hypothetical protein GIB67_023109 [Kingdonia uniflora]|uniref:C2 domain-containing protein n=1 Tax=Kingdonia uniflora TaxID=39325 RepID=A0A7J7M5V4_9MAGN|nr:hypothetical protein GIB67_023109 [Kingdonia uniflora]
MANRRKLVVEVVDARSLLPKDGHGTSSPYVMVDFYGQRKRTRTVHRDLNPNWNELLEFNVGVSQSEVFGDILEIDVHHDRIAGPTRRNNFLGRIRLNSTQFVRKGEEALMYFPLEKKNFFSWIQGEIGLKIYYVNEEPPPPPPPESDPQPPPQSESDPQQPPQPESGPPPPQPESDPQPIGEQNIIEQSSGEANSTQQQSEQLPVEPPAKPKETVPDPTTVKPLLEPKDEAPAPQPQNVPQESPQESDPQPPPPDPPIILSMMSNSIKEVKSAGNIARPISRQTTTESFFQDPSERCINDRTSYDLVEKMYYIFVRIVKARSLPTQGNPIVKISVSGCHARSNPARRTRLFEWDETFAFGRASPDAVSTLEISVWDSASQSDVEDLAAFIGGLAFDVTDIPQRDPPDSPLAPEWYRLEGGGAHNGDLMIATWVGTQADEAFSDALKTDTTGNISSSLKNSKIYNSPKLWYLRATVIEAQDITALRETSFQVRAQLGFQILKTKPSVSRNGSPLWDEDLIFVAAEPFGDHLIFSLESRQSKGPKVLGIARVPLTMIERRVDDRKVVARWFSLEDTVDDKKVYRGRVHLRLCYDGGYHVMEESPQVCSDFRPTARQLWKPSIGTVELGIIGCRHLLPMKMLYDKGTTDAYSVVKYGQKWVRTRTIMDSLDPRWNEQYTWKVYDPCTVISIGVFDNWGVQEANDCKDAMPVRPDLRIGKVRIRISTLETGRVYKNTYPLLFLSPNGVKKMGDIDLALRFICTVPKLDLLHVYSQPMMPYMHHIKPLGAIQQDMLRNAASKVVADNLSRSEPPLFREVVLYMLDTDSQVYGMRKIRVNWLRIINVVAGVADVVRWVEDTRSWKNPTGTALVHVLLVMLIWFPDLIVPTFAFYLFVIGVWHYRFRAKNILPTVDLKMSLTDIIDRDELEEEFDTMPSSRPAEVIRARYDKLRMVAARVQNVLGELAMQGERVQALVTWRDPRATGIFVALCFIIALVLYLVPSKMVAIALGFYYLRHPMFRDRMPSPALNFFRRLPSLSDRLI